MAYEECLKTISRPASGDLSSNQFYFVDVDSNGEVTTAGDGAAGIGVLQNDPEAQGIAANVGFAGVSRVAAGGSITAGDDVASDADGRAVTAASGDVVLGKAFESASGAGSITTVLIQANG